ncbi:MAG TPA: inorganic phosphate transporter [bacterium]|nr:inorganic phosphate transporter [bacterium]
MIIPLILISAFLAVNMGVSGFAVSFTPSYGSGILKKRDAVILYAIFVFAGGILVGPRVVETLVGKISLQRIGTASSLIIIVSATIMMTLSNLLKIPQSTSFVAVAAFVGAGLFHGAVNWQTVIRIIRVAALFSAASFALTYWLARRVYPPHPDNLKFYEKFYAHRSKFKKFIVWTDIYSAFGIGTNNVANVVAPFVAAVPAAPLLPLAGAAPFFGLGSYLWGEKVLKTVSKDIIPIGEISASVVSLITASFVIIASLLGLPTPYVQFSTFSVLAVSCVKDGFGKTFEKAIFKKIVSVWLLVPAATALLSLFLHRIILGR